MSTIKKAASKKKTAKTPAKATKPEVPPVRETIQAPYKFTPEEVSTMERALRGELSQIETLTDQKKASAKDFALRIENRTNNVTQLRHKLDTGEETRAFEALVTFDAPKKKKSYFYNLDGKIGAFIREEEMTPADFQLPMFSVEKDGTLKSNVIAMPAQKKAGANGTTPPPADPAPGGVPDDKGEGKTNVGAALDVATLKTTVAPITLNLEGKYESAGLTRAFRMAAKSAKWSEPQIKFLAAEMKKADTVEKMIETLRPFVKEVQP